MRVELEQLHVCHAYIKQARIEEFSSGGGGKGSNLPKKKIDKPPPPTKKKKPTKMGDRGRFLQYLFCISMVEI